MSTLVQEDDFYAVSEASDAADELDATQVEEETPVPTQEESQEESQEEVGVGQQRTPLRALGNYTLVNYTQSSASDAEDYVPKYAARLRKTDECASKEETCSETVEVLSESFLSSQKISNTRSSSSIEKIHWPIEKDSKGVLKIATINFDMSLLAESLAETISNSKDEPLSAMVTYLKAQFPYWGGLLRSDSFIQSHDSESLCEPSSTLNSSDRYCRQDVRWVITVEHAKAGQRVFKLALVVPASKIKRQPWYAPCILHIAFFQGRCVAIPAPDLDINMILAQAGDPTSSDYTWDAVRQLPKSDLILNFPRCVNTGPDLKENVVHKHSEIREEKDDLCSLGAQTIPQQEEYVYDDDRSTCSAEIEPAQVDDALANDENTVLGDGAYDQPVNDADDDQAPAPDGKNKESGMEAVQADSDAQEDEDFACMDQAVSDKKSAEERSVRVSSTNNMEIGTHLPSVSGSAKARRLKRRRPIFFSDDDDDDDRDFGERRQENDKNSISGRDDEQQAQAEEMPSTMSSDDMPISTLCGRNKGPLRPQEEAPQVYADTHTMLEDATSKLTRAADSLLRVADKLEADDLQEIAELNETAVKLKQIQETLNRMPLDRPPQQKRKASSHDKTAVENIPKRKKKVVIMRNPIEKGKLDPSKKKFNVLWSYLHSSHKWTWCRGTELQDFLYLKPGYKLPKSTEERERDLGVYYFDDEDALMQYADENNLWPDAVLASQQHGPLLDDEFSDDDTQSDDDVMPAPKTSRPTARRAKSLHSTKKPSKRNTRKATTSATKVKCGTPATKKRSKSPRSSSSLAKRKKKDTDAPSKAYSPVDSMSQKLEELWTSAWRPLQNQGWHFIWLSRSRTGVAYIRPNVANQDIVLGFNAYCSESEVLAAITEDPDGDKLVPQTLEGILADARKAFPEYAISLEQRITQNLHINVHSERLQYARHKMRYVELERASVPRTLRSGERSRI